VIDVGRYAISSMARLLARTAPLAIAITSLALLASASHAQNLIKDPYFTNGVPSYASTDSAGNTYYPYLATPSTFDGLTGVTLSGSSYGYFYVNPLGGYDTNSVNYVFTFFAAAVNPDLSSPVYAQFAYTTDPSSTSSLYVPSLGSGLTQYTLTGTSINLNGNTGYFYVQAYGGGDVFVTGLDLEAAPAPVTGGGVLSFGIVLAGVAAHRLRRRKLA
jgi:hypothetical protein